MTSLRTLLVPVLLIAALVGGAGAVWQSIPDDPPPAVPAITPVGGIELLHARPFTLAQPYLHEWSTAGTRVSAGYLLVLGVDPALVHPRQVAEPVLYVGAQTAERINFGHESGRVVAVVPALPNGRGGVALDWSVTPIFFGAPALPEQVDVARMQAELAAARTLGIAPPSQQSLQAALQPAVHFGSREDLHLHASDLIEAFSPMEVDLISGLRAPRVGG
ncbi:MAG: hypothetical protein ACT4PU_00450 [Planctomycetota bacterium]